MNEPEAIKEDKEVLTCPHCWQEFRRTYHFSWLDPGYEYRTTAEQELKCHEKHCSKNPNSPEWKLLIDIRRCQCEARIYHCLNCQHYQKECEGTKI